MITVQKDPADRDQFGFSYVGQIPDEDTIQTSVWDPVQGLTLDTPTHDGEKETRVWISSGAIGTAYDVSNTITTTQGRTLKRWFRLSVVRFYI